MSLNELLLTGFRRKFTRPRFLIALALLFLAGIFLIFASGGRGGFFYAGVFSILYAALVPLQLFLTMRRVLTRYSWFTAPTTLTFGESGIAIVAPDYRSELGWSQFRSWSQSEHHIF